MISHATTPILTCSLAGETDSRATRIPEFTQSGRFAQAPPASTAEFWICAGGSPDRQPVDYAGTACSLKDVIAAQGSGLLGKRHGSETILPVQIRVFEATERQALQVCASLQGGRMGNSLFWFSLSSNGDPQVAAGIKHRVTRSQFLDALHSHGLWDMLRVFPAPAGDAFFMAPGVVFAADRGCVLLEVSHPSLTRQTIRAWTDSLEDASRATRQIRFAERVASRIRPDVQPMDRTRKIPLVNVSPDFDIDELRVADYFFGRTDGSVPHILCTTTEPASVETNGGRIDMPPLTAGIVPACASDYNVRIHETAAKVLRIIPKTAFG